MTSDHPQPRLASPEKFFQTFAAALPVAVLTQDANGRITFANPAAASILGVPQAELPGHTLAEPCWRVVQRDGTPLAEAEHPVTVALRTGQPVPDVVMGVGRPNDEAITWLRVSAVPEGQADGAPPTQVCTTLEEITAQIEAEEAAQQQRKLAAALQSGLAALTASLDEADVLEQILKTAVDVVPYEAATVLLLDGHHVRMTYSRGFSPEIQEEIKKHVIPLAQPNFYDLYYNQKPYLIEDAHQVAEWVNIPGTEWIRASIAVPIEMHGVVLGVLTVDHSEPGFFTQEDVVLLHAIARQAALALAHTRRAIFLQSEIERHSIELDRSQQQQSFILDNIADTILLLDANLTIQVVNKTFCHMFGFAEDIVVVQGQPVGAVLHPDDAAALASLATAMLADRASRDELLTFHRSDGTLFLAELRLIYAATNQQEARLICTIRDVSAREALKTALSDSEKRWQFALEGSGDGFWDWNLATSQVYYAPQWKFMLGYEEKEIGDGLDEWQARVHPDDLPRCLATIQAHLDGRGPSFTNEHRLLCKDGSYKWVLDRGQVIERDANGRPLRAIGIHTDISRSKQTEADLLQQTKLLQILMGLALDFINVPLRQLDEAINEALGRVAQFNNADRAYLLLYDWQNQVMNNTHEWCAPGIVPEIENLQQVPMALFPEWVSAHQSGQPIHIPDVAALPAGPLREILEPQGIQTLITLPLLHGDHCFGSVGFDAVNSLQRWTAEDVTLLQMLAELLVNAEVRRLSETAVKQAEDRLKHNEMRLRKAQRIAKLGYWELDLSTLAMHWSDELFAIFGYDPADGMPTYLQIEQSIHPEDFPAYLDSVRFAVKQGVPFDLELRVVRPDGRLRHCLVRSEPLLNQAGRSTRIDGTLLDITERVEIERALRDLTDRLELALRSGNIGIWEWKPAPAAFYGDGRMHELFGLPVDVPEICLEPWLTAVHPDETGLVAQQFNQALLTAQEVELEFRTVAPDGQVRHLKAYGIIQRDKSQQQVERVIGIGLDITQNKQVEQVLRQALQREKELGELKSRFVSMASHEFRNPMAVILAAVETLLAYRAKLSDEQMDQRLNSIRQHIFFMRAMTDDVLQLSRIESGHGELNPAPVDLDGLCQAIIGDYAGLPDLAHTIHYQFAGAAPVWLALDERLMRQVIANLLSNALKYTPPGKNIFVELQVTAETAVIAVRDEGIGIPTADLDNLFEPFCRASNVGTISGTGLGLAIARRLVKLHGGNITVLSEVGVGSTFSVHLPQGKGAAHEQDISD